MPTDTVQIADTTITELFLQNMGVKQVLVGDTLIYERQGGYFYLKLDTKETD